MVPGVLNLHVIRAILLFSLAVYHPDTCFIEASRVELPSRGLDSWSKALYPDLHKQLKPLAERVPIISALRGRGDTCDLSIEVHVEMDAVMQSSGHGSSVGSGEDAFESRLHSVEGDFEANGHHQRNAESNVSTAVKWCNSSQTLPIQSLEQAEEGDQPHTGKQLRQSRTLGEVPCAGQTETNKRNDHGQNIKGNRNSKREGAPKKAKIQSKATHPRMCSWSEGCERQATYGSADGITFFCLEHKQVWLQHRVLCPSCELDYPSFVLGHKRLKSWVAANIQETGMQSGEGQGHDL